jgi:citrate lyase gamma subunit
MPFTTAKHRPTQAKSPKARSSPQPRPDFDHDARQALEGLRDALAALVAALPGGTPGRAVDLGASLKIGTELRWQVFTLASAVDVFEAGVHVPKAGSMETLLRAAAKAKVADRCIKRVRAAYAQYERVVDAHASDRGAFDSMLRALSARRGDQIDVRLRKNLFQRQAVLWGLRQKVSFRCTILHRGARDDLLDGINLMGSVELHSLRNGVPLSLMVTSELRNHIPSPDRITPPIDEAPGTVEPLTMLHEFCSGPVPEAVAAPYEPGGTKTTLRFGGLGRGRALNLALAQVCRGAQVSGMPEISGDVRVNTPTELLCDDMLVPVGWSLPDTVRVHVYANRLNSEEVWKKQPEDRLPMHIVPTHQGRVRLKAPEPARVRPMPEFVEVPRYAEIVAKVLNEIGWADTEFDLYRCRVEYPVIQSLTELVVDGVIQRA